MKPLSTSYLEEISISKKPALAIHIVVHNYYTKFGYAKTQKWIRKNLEDWNRESFLSVKEYLVERVECNELFEPSREVLMKLVLNSDYNEMKVWVYKMSTDGFRKEKIYKILLELFVIIQRHPDTKSDDKYHEKLAEFLDRFTYLGKNYRILPNEPDI